MTNQSLVGPSQQLRRAADLIAAALESYKKQPLREQAKVLVELAVITGIIRLSVDHPGG